MSIDLKSNFTSTGEKLLLWPEILYKLRKQRLPTPINIQISPTNACNLDCWFCSVGKRDKSLQLSLDKILKFVDELSASGTVKAIEITGGGEPTLYPEIEELIIQLKARNLSIGLITNGLELYDLVSGQVLEKLAWIRISMNTYEDLGRVQIPKVEGTTLGFSYLWGKPGVGVDGYGFLHRLMQIAKRYNVQYIRLVPNCLEDVALVRDKLTKIASSLGPPVFFQEKIARKPKLCYLGYIKPFLYSDGLVYPCNSISLSPEADLDFPKSLAMFPMSKAAKWMQTDVHSGNIDPSICNSCRFADQNDLLATVLSENFKHKEHV